MFTITTLSSPNSLSQKDIRLLSSELIVLEMDDLQIPSSPYFPAYDYAYAQGHGQGPPPMVQERFQCVISQLFQHLSLMESKLRSGTTLIVDRYSFSGVAFSSTKGLDFEWCKMKKWKGWESDTSSLEYQFTNDPARFRFSHQTSFVRRHTRFSRTPGIRWIVAFFRQFFGSVSKVEYITMRNGFINFPTVGFCCHLTAAECLQLVHACLDLISATHCKLNLRSLAAPSFIDEITQRVTQDVESRFTTMIKNLTARVLFLESQGMAGSMSLREVSDASSGQQASKENE
ncbi:unnamed protein product [Camellia sinensis]